MPKLRPPKNTKPNQFKNATNTVPEEYIDRLNKYLEKNKEYYSLQMRKEFNECRVTNSISINRVRNRYYKHKEVINLRVNKDYTNLTEFISKCLPIVNEAISKIVKRYDLNTIQMVNIDTSIGKDDFTMKVKIICECYGEMIFPD